MGTYKWPNNLELIQFEYSYIQLVYGCIWSVLVLRFLDLFVMMEDMVFIILLVMQPSTILLQGSSIIPNHYSSATSETFILDKSYSLNDFEDVLIKYNHIFVDKTMFIMELINRIERCELISRPSRWGKTFNMEMTATFFDIPHHKDGSVDEHKRNIVRSFFAGGAKIVVPSRKSPSEMKPLKISEIESAMDEIGNHPTIFISFVNAGTTYEAFLMNFAAQIRGLIVQKNYAAFLPQYCEFYVDPELCNELLNSTREELKSYPHAALNQSVEILTCLLTRHFGSETVILIDEFDYPLNRMTYDSEDFNKTTDFLKSFIGWTFKGRPKMPSNIYRGVITGVLQFSRVGVSTGMTVCRDCSVLKPSYSEHFGFTEEDIQTLFEKNPSSPLNLSELHDWYDGYTFGESRLYNPVSIRRCFISRRMDGYWIESVPMDLNPRSGENSLHQPFMLDAYQSQIQKLFVNETIKVHNLISEIDYNGAANHLKSFLSLLISLGYLTFEKTSGKQYNILIPNYEVRDFAFKNSIEVWTMKYVFADSVIIHDILYEIQNGFVVNDITAVQGGLSNLFSKIAETAPADYYCDVVFGLLTQFDDEWDLERSFDEVITIYEQVEFQCSITLRLKLDHCYNTNPIAINFIINGDSTMEQNIIHGAGDSTFEQDITEAATSTTATVAHATHAHATHEETFSTQRQRAEAQLTSPTINRRTTGVISQHIGEIKKIIINKLMDYSKKTVAQLTEKSVIKAAKLMKKSMSRVANLTAKYKFTWHTCILVGKKILGMFRHLK
ncbi:uncharacterized protein LOC135846594 [Planococcus citri]|uniref:uncharacterized protein LOC135846594 n=1 Tax=Planococcus citri TaxID=170843 RepID=UPI0031F83F8A